MKAFKFYKLFPKADTSKFAVDEGGNVIYKKNSQKVDDIHFWFGDGPDFLGLSQEELKQAGETKNFFLNDSALEERKTDSLWKGPIEWKPITNEIPPQLVFKLRDLDFENFRIYVNEKDFFMLHDSFPNFGNEEELDMKDNKKNHTVSVKAFYILSYLGGIGIKNLASENNLAKSLAYFYFYYHLKKFLNYRDFSGYNLNQLYDRDWSIYTWRNHFVWYHSQVHYTKDTLKIEKDDIIRNIKHVGKKVLWQTRNKKRDFSKDYLKLIQQPCEGLTKIGQLLFQESCQAYVYAILGAQAKTRWKIIGDGANSYQTQKLFKTLVQDLISQNNISYLIKSMRVAIQATKVRLDFCISPGLELLPSSMVYIENSPGYNNILLVSSPTLKFGVNNVNNKLKIEKKDAVKEKIAAVEEKKAVVEKGVSSAPSILTGGVIAVLIRIIWVAFL